MEPWFPVCGEAPAPIPILTDMGGHSRTDLSWFFTGVHEFITYATSIVGMTSRPWRDRPLFALPLVASGEGGKSRDKGSIALALIDQIKKFIADLKLETDVALVLNHDVAYQAAQAARNTETWPDLSDQLKLIGNSLAERARRENLVLFLGSGVSKPSGLPLWKELILGLAAEYSMSQEEMTALEDLPVLDAASAVEARSTSPEDFRRSIARWFQTPMYGLPHALLATLDVRETVTTNYDRLYESACNDLKRPLSILPHDPDSKAHSWLLKLHGSIDKPEDIVITRRDYLRYQHNRAALYGIVQAMLITRHILFVGFSLSDDNFHLVIDEVRRALDGDQTFATNVRERQPFGTAIVQKATLFSNTLWSADLNVMSVTSDGDDLLIAARTTELFLDYVAFKAAMPLSHFFDESYSASLTNSDVRIKKALSSLHRALLDDLNQVNTIPIIELLHRYGFQQL